MRAWELYEGKKHVGYKVMRYENGNLIAGADSRQIFPSKIGSSIQMKGNGIYLGTNKQYVLDYYSGLADDERLLTFEFDEDDITTGNLTDQQVEVSVSNAILKNIEEFDQQ